MATNRSFSAMLNEYLPNDLLREEAIQRDYLLSKVEKDDGWLTGNLVVPFKGAGASSVSYGQLTAQTDVSEDKYVRGTITQAQEVWGTMVFNHRDLMEHNKISEKNFLKILPNTVDDFMALLKNTVSIGLLSGAHVAKATAAATAATGVVSIDHVERLNINQKLQWVDNGPAQATGYISAIDMNAKTITLVTARGGATPVDFSAAAGARNLASGGKLYNDGVLVGTTVTNAFSSLRDALLSAANGGSASLYGVTKTAYPYLQAINITSTQAGGGAALTSTLVATDPKNLVAGIFTALGQIRQYGRGAPEVAVMSYNNFMLAVKIIEASKGAFNVKPGSQSASIYGWTEIEVGSVKGPIKFVAVQEMDDDVIMFIDWRALKFYSNGFFKKRQSPDGHEYFEVRAQSGFQYLIDVCLFGDLVVHRPSYCGILCNLAIIY